VSPTLHAVLRSWPIAPWLVVALLVSAGVYLRGWVVLHRRDPRRWHRGQIAAFCGSLAAIYLALASPIEPFASLLLQVHMVQHILFMMVAPPLVWLGEPLFPMLRGLPRSVRTYWIAPFLSWPPLRKIFARLTHPLTALAILIATTWIWHVPARYELALRSDGWHYVQHVCFLAAGLLFWYPVVRAFPGRPRWSRWLLLPCLLAADLSNTLLSALLTFADGLLYPYYAGVPRLGGFSALQDQAVAGVIMWVPGSLIFLFPLFVLGVRLLSRPKPARVRRSRPVSLATYPASDRLPVIALPTTPPGSSFDLLRVPLVGRFLKWRHARLCLQIPLMLLAGLVIYDGLFGPQVGAMNLAGVLPWIHWRGLLILGLLVLGNVFCMGCPFLLPRTIARRWLPVRWNWPRRLRNKWIAVLLLVIFLWAYETLSLWDRPGWTAGLAIGYFAAAFLIDGMFHGASFCKYVCPIGQFNFVQSLVSPLEVKPRDQSVCASCRTQDCIRGRDGVPGCELQLFLPRKVGNMDCTACLDCVHACPHDNVALAVRPSGAELTDDRPRSGTGRLSRRPDIAALVLVLVFGAFANAAGMVAPVTGRLKLVAKSADVPNFLPTTAFHLFALIILPLVTVGGAAALSRHWSGQNCSILNVASKYACALVPLGSGMWLAHYSFHFLTSWKTVLPVAQRFAGDHGVSVFGRATWSMSCCGPMPAWLLPLEILFLDLGLLLSLYTAWKIAPTLKALAPWALLMLFMFAAGIWILIQPMQMRGTL
jgi:cytochrome c oxidase assembly factor CtaG